MIEWRSGILGKLSYAEYASIDAVRWSSLKNLRVSPLAYQHHVTHSQPETLPLRMGRIVHALTLEPERFDDSFAIWEGTRRGKAWDAFKERNGDVDIIKDTELELGRAIAAAVLRHPTARALIDRGITEQTICWLDAATGLRCKARPDITANILVDLKSAVTADQRLFAAAMARMGYAGQLAFYGDGCAAVGIDLAPEPVLIAVESKPPHDVVCYGVVEQAVERGRQEYRKLLGLLKQCLDSDTWPGRAPGDIVPLDLPAWSYAGGDEELELTIGGEKVAI